MKQDGTCIQEQSTESTTTTSLPVEHGTVHRMDRSEGLVDNKSTKFGQVFVWCLLLLLVYL